MVTGLLTCHCDRNQRETNWANIPVRYHLTQHTNLEASLFDHVATNAALGLDGSMDLRQRSNLVQLDRELHGLWSLGRNCILGWSPTESGVLILVVHHYVIAEYTSSPAGEIPEEAVDPSGSHDFIMSMLTGSRRFTQRQLENAARLLDATPVELNLRHPLAHAESESLVIDQLVQRYSVTYVPSRAVALFDIVGFSLLTPLEQMTQLNSLSHSLNSAHSKMLNRHIEINFARSSTGDGYYIWNRDLGVEANTHLYHFMHLVLADNAIARSKARGRTVPLLRACFHIDSCYEFYQAEGLNPTMRSDIVGDVTIELARMIERALPGQVLVGEFRSEPAADDVYEPDFIHIDSIGFVANAQENLAKLNGLELSGDAIESIKCYLTGRAQADGTFTVRKLTINDKHGLTRNVFNAKINIYRCVGEPILLGIEDRLLRGESATVRTTAHIRTDPRGDNS
jgi:hypothetical protein